MVEYFRVYNTKKEWVHQARVFMIVGLICGLGIGASLTCLIFMLVLGMI